MTEKVQSPCQDVCYMEDGICTTCGMTAQESNTWYRLNEEERRKIVDRLAALEKAKKDAEGN